MHISDATIIDTDLLIIGTGFAGLWAAIAAREAGVGRVTLVDKAAIALSSQSKMSAGATIYCLPTDDADAWLGDIVSAQEFLCHQDMVADMLATSHARLGRIEGWGVRYRRALWGGYLRLPSRGFHRVRMLVEPELRGRVGGSAVVMALRAAATRLGVGKFRRVFVTALLKSGGRVIGAIGFDRTTGIQRLFRAGAVVLAAGDCSFRGGYVGTGAATGDAFHLAYEAGARLGNMEFLAVNTGPPSYGFEGTGVVLRFGGRLVNATGEPFMRRYHPDGDAAEIGVLVQGMARETRAGNGPPFQLRVRPLHRPFLRHAFAGMGGFMPRNLQKLATAGVDVLGQPQEWSPAVQSLRGGVWTDADGHSNLPGLFAAGLAQCFDPGLFNGWSSMRAMWSGERVGRAAAAFLRAEGNTSVAAADFAECVAGIRQPEPRADGPPADAVLQTLQRALFPYDVCILKHHDRLTAALCVVEDLRDNALPVMRAADPHELAKAHETANMVTVAEMFLRASMLRRESRTDHYREDFPQRNDRDWLRWITVCREASGAMRLDTEPIPFDCYGLRPPQRSA